VLSNSCFRIAKELNSMVAPVGVAWSYVLEQKPSLQVFHQDGSHPSPVGSYLASCVFYSVFFKRSPVGLPRTLFTVKRDGSHVKVGELSEVDAEIIQRAVWKSVQEVTQFK
jgi:hypothetical protein